MIILIFKGCNEDYDQAPYEDFIIITPYHQKIITERVILEIPEGTVLENTEIYLNPWFIAGLVAAFILLMLLGWYLWYLRRRKAI